MRAGADLARETLTAAMIGAQSLSLMLTFRCDVRCDHCAVHGSPGRREEMPEELAYSSIDQAARIPGLKMVAYTGGEPMLRYPALLRLMGHAGSMGLDSGVVSNSSWARTEDIARTRFAEMTDRGLTTYITSLDEYHLRHIDAACVRNAVQAALAAGLAVHLNMLWTPGCVELLRRLPAILELPAAVIDGHGAYGLHVWTGLPARARRVRESVSGAPLALSGREQAYRCDHIMRHPVMSFDGSIYACCGVADATPWGPSRIGYAGTVAADRLARVLGRMRHNLLFNLLAECGPLGVLELVRRHYSRVCIPSQAMNPCELCGHLRSDAVSDALAATLHTLSAGLDDKHATRA